MRWYWLGRVKRVRRRVRHGMGELPELDVPWRRRLGARGRERGGRRRPPALASTRSTFQTTPLVGDAAAAAGLAPCYLDGEHGS